MPCLICCLSFLTYSSELDPISSLGSDNCRSDVDKANNILANAFMLDKRLEEPLSTRRPRSPYRSHKPSESNHSSFGRKDKFSSSSTRNKSCRECYSKHKPADCPAKSWTCYSCGQKGHTSRFCRAKTANYIHYGCHTVKYQADESPLVLANDQSLVALKSLFFGPKFKEVAIDSTWISSRLLKGPIRFLDLETY
ncbi:hypothetical protein ILUMI_09653, partial [Ignelater luminosus]